MDGFSGEEGAGGKGGWQEKKEKGDRYRHIMNNMCGRERERERESQRERERIFPRPLFD